MAGPIDVPSVPGHVLVRRTPGAGPVYIPFQPEVGQFDRVVLFDHEPTDAERDAFELPVVTVWHLDAHHAHERPDFQVLDGSKGSAPAQPVESTPAEPAQPSADGAPEMGGE